METHSRTNHARHPPYVMASSPARPCFLRSSAHSPSVWCRCARITWSPSVRTSMGPILALFHSRRQRNDCSSARVSQRSAPTWIDFFLRGQWPLPLVSGGATHERFEYRKRCHLRQRIGGVCEALRCDRADQCTSGSDAGVFDGSFDWSGNGLRTYTRTSGAWLMQTA